MNILFIDQNFGESNIGGAFKSNYALINELMENPEITVRVLARFTKDIKKKGFRAKRIKRPSIKIPIKQLSLMIKFFRISRYLTIYPILREIRRFKPVVIVVQRDLTSSALVAGFIKRIPVINIIRDAMGFCPKHIDIINPATNCLKIISRKDCWKCIDRWRSLRVLFGDKSKGWERSFRAILYTINYKLRYFLTKLYLYLLNYATVNVVASPLMHELVEKKISNDRILVKKITPIAQYEMEISHNRIKPNDFERITKSDKKILFVIPRHEGGSKGYHFVKAMLNKLPESYLVIIVGTKLRELKNYENVINISEVPTDNLYYLYRNVNLTIVPSHYSEAFGRVIIESIVNGTPVLISPQCGAKYLFEDKEYVRIVPLKLNLWLNEIKKFIETPITISKSDIQQIEHEFSPKECANELIKLIKILKKK